MAHKPDGILLSHKKEQINVICSNMDATRDSHKNDRKTILYDITYVESKIWQKMILSKKQEQITDMECRPVVARGKRGEIRIDGEFGVGRCKLLYLEWVSNEV